MKQNSLTKILNLTLAALGFTTLSSCDPSNNPFVCMYGMPSMDFEVSGKVTDQESNPIAGIQVSCPETTDKITSGKDGSFKISGKGMVARLLFEDIDGPDNGGEFATKGEVFDVKQVAKGDKAWYMGRYEAKDVTVTLEKK